MLPADTTVWQHFDCFITMKSPNSPVNAGSTTIAALDTISFGGMKYKKVYDLNDYGMNYSFKTLIGYMREDTTGRKVYFKQNAGASEQLIYDFSKIAGDSVYFSFNDVSYNGYYRIDSIIVKNERCGPRRHFYLRKHFNNPYPSVYYLDHIESIGSNYHALYFTNYLWWGCQFADGYNTCHWTDWGIGLSCKYNSVKKQYQSCTFVIAQMDNCINPVDSCNYHNTCSGLKTSAYNSRILVSPNPVNDQLKIESEGLKGTISVKVTDVMGREIFSETKQDISDEEMQINTHSLVNGIYFIRIEHQTGFFVREFAVSH